MTRKEFFNLRIYLILLLFIISLSACTTTKKVVTESDCQRWFDAYTSITGLGDVEFLLRNKVEILNDCKNFYVNFANEDKLCERDDSNYDFENCNSFIGFTSPDASVCFTDTVIKDYNNSRKFMMCYIGFALNKDSNCKILEGKSIVRYEETWESQQLIDACYKRKSIIFKDKNYCDHIKDLTIKESCIRELE